MKPRWWVVFRKEAIDGMRDRRSLLSIVISALITAGLLLFMFDRAAERSRDSRTVDVELPIVNAEHAGPLVDWLGQQDGIVTVDPPEDPRQAIRDRDVKMVLVIDEDFREDYEKGLPANVRLLNDGSWDESRPAVRRVQDLLRRYTRLHAGLRLMARGISPQVMQPVDLDMVNVEDRSRGGVRSLLGIIPIMLIVGGFVGALQLATDTTAGERERGSLEPLLANPVSATSVATGKWLAGAALGGANIVLSLIAMMIVFEQAPLAELGVRFRPEPLKMLLLVACAAPLAFFASGVETLIATFARSYKEAQTYLGYVIMVPSFVPALTIFYPIDEFTWPYFVPILAQLQLLQRVLSGGVMPWHWFAVGSAMTIGLGVACMLATARLFERETVIFTR